MNTSEIKTKTKDELLSKEFICELLDQQDALSLMELKSAAEDRARSLGCKGDFQEKFAVLKKIVVENGTRTFTPIQGVSTAVELMENDAELDALQYNSLAHAKWVRGCLPWRKDEGGFREWTNLDDGLLLAYMEKKYMFGNSKKLETATDIVAYQRRFNPITESLNMLADKWDGGHYIEKLLPDYLGARPGRLTTEALKLVMLGAINRAFHPGCKFDSTLVLIGRQGIGKSTFIRLLAIREEWFSDAVLDLNSDRPAEVILGKWFVEFSELLALKRAREAEAVKAFLTRTSDRMRLPYERLAEDYPRSCVFIGSTNDNGFLSDKTGNRRFIPVEVGINEPTKSLFAKEAFSEFMMAWSEAMNIYKSGAYTLTLPDDLLQEIEDERSKFMEQDPDEEKIEKWISDHPEIRRTCSSQLYKEALGFYDRMTKGEARSINAIMSSLPGWKKTDKKVKFAGYGSVFGYERISDDGNRDGNQMFMPIPDDVEGFSPF